MFFLFWFLTIALASPAQTPNKQPANPKTATAPGQNKAPPNQPKNKSRRQNNQKRKPLDLKTTLQYITEGIGTNPQALNLSTSLRGKAMEYLKANSTRIGSVINSQDFEPASCGFIEQSHLTPHFLGTPMDDAIEHVQSQIQPKQKRHIRLYRRCDITKKSCQRKTKNVLDKKIAKPFMDKVGNPTRNAFEHTIPDQLDKHVAKPINDKVIKPAGDFFEHDVPNAFKKAGRDLKKGWKDFTNAFKSPENFKRVLQKLGEVSKKAWNIFVDYIKQYKNELIITAALIAVALATAVVITLAPEFAPFLTELALEAGAEIGGEAAVEGVAEGVVEGAVEAGGATEGSSAAQTAKQIFGNTRKLYEAIDDIRGDVEDAYYNAQDMDQMRQDIMNPQDQGYEEGSDEGYEEEEETTQQ